MLLPRHLLVCPQGIDYGTLWNSAAAAFIGNPDKRAFKAVEIGDLLPNAPKMTDRQVMNFAASVSLAINERKQAT